MLGVQPILKGCVKSQSSRTCDLLSTVPGSCQTLLASVLLCRQVDTFTRVKQTVCREKAKNFPNHAVQSDLCTVFCNYTAVDCGVDYKEMFNLAYRTEASRDC